MLLLKIYIQPDFSSRKTSKRTTRQRLTTKLYTRELSGDGGSGQYKAVCKNANSIGVEVRPYKVNAKSLLASDKDWCFREATTANLTKLVRSLMAAHGIDADHVIRYYDVTAKACPRPWVGDDINTYCGKTGNQLWTEFKVRLTESEDDNMVRYNALDDIPNEYGFRDIIEILMNAKIIKGDGSDPDGNGDVIDLSHDQVRSLVFEYRGGAFDRKLIAEGKEPAVSV